MRFRRAIVIAETAEAEARYQRLDVRDWRTWRKRLQSFRQGGGLTPDKAASTSNFYLEQLDVPTPRDFYPLICAVLDSMDQDARHVQALRNAYFGDEKCDLMTRRERFGAKHGINTAQVARLEDNAIEELLERLAKRTQSEATEEPTPDIEELSIKDLLLGLTKAMQEQNELLREISAKLDRR